MTFYATMVHCSTRLEEFTTRPVDELVWNEGEFHFLRVYGRMDPEKSFLYISFYTFSTWQSEGVVI